jgi:hypothetical protein
MIQQIVGLRANEIGGGEAGRVDRAGSAMGSDASERFGGTPGNAGRWRAISE